MLQSERCSSLGKIIELTNGKMRQIHVEYWYEKATNKNCIKMKRYSALIVIPIWVLAMKVNAREPSVLKWKHQIAITVSSSQKGLLVHTSKEIKGPIMDLVKTNANFLSISQHIHNQPAYLRRLHCLQLRLVFTHSSLMIASIWIFLLNQSAALLSMKWWDLATSHLFHSLVGKYQKLWQCCLSRGRNYC